MNPIIIEIIVSGFLSAIGFDLILSKINEWRAKRKSQKIKIKISDNQTIEINVEDTEDEIKKKLKLLRELTRPQVFLAYSSLDYEKIKPIIHQLEEANIKTWYFDKMKIGKSLKNTIEQNIKESSFIIAFLSNNIIKSKPAQREFELFKNYKKPIIPILIDENLTELPLELKDILYADYVKRKEVAIEKVIDTIKNTDANNI